MAAAPDPARIRVLAPNFKRRLSGVTATVVRLVPLQARKIEIAAVGRGLPPEVPQIRLRDLIFLPRRTARVWHARRNVEMVAGLALKHLLRKNLRLLFTSASQRHHTLFTKTLIRRMDAVVATSRKTAQYLDRDATVILHGIDVETFCPASDKSALKAQLGLPAGPLVGCYGRIRHQKGTDVFVDAMISVLKDRPDACGLVMGRATEKHVSFQSDLKARIAAEGLAARILFLPEVPAHQMARWYQVLDLFVAPQRWEGFGLTPLEAMACAVPVVATTVGAFDELVTEGETGFLIPPGEVAPMAEAVARLLDDQVAMAAFSTAARKRVEQSFRIEGEAAALIALYRGLLESPR